MSNPNTAVIMQQDQQKLDNTLEFARGFVERDYMHMLGSPATVPRACAVAGSGTIRICRISKVVRSKEDANARLLSVLHAVGSISDACFLLIRGTKKGVDFYLGLRSQENAEPAVAAMRTSLQGNFPGTVVSVMDTADSDSLLNDLFGAQGQSIAAVSRVPSRRRLGNPNGDSTEVQGIERFLDAMRGQEYTALVLAEPVRAENTALRRNALEKLSTSLSVLERIGYQYSNNTTISEQHSVNQSITQGITDSVSYGYNRSYNTSNGINRGNGNNLNTQFLGLGFGYGSQQGSFSSNGQQVGDSNQWQHGVSLQNQHGVGVTTGVSLGISEGWTMNHTNKAVLNLQQQIDQQLHRIGNCEIYGCRDACAFFLAPSLPVARVAAGNFHALICGVDSGRDNASISMWTPASDTGRAQLPTLLASLRNMTLPVFDLNSTHPFNMGTMVSSEELPLLMNLPRTSVPGLPVQQMAAFGREVHTIDGTTPGSVINLGRTFHMGVVEAETKIGLSINDLTSHTAFFGASGVGKSTAVSIILNALSTHQRTNFLLIEPVKGEYKYMLGNVPGMQVFTTDPVCCRMLHINPFEFPARVHVLSHIDRLMEVFSVCWPLYAAQPALLRECVEEAYMRAGWDLSNSIYIGDGGVKYPDFHLLLSIVPEIIKRSKFVGESKGTYEGALLTRIAMLTHGIYGEVLNSSSNISDKELFDGRVVVDLSNVGSQEAMALIMGVMVIRLREHRMATGRANNQPLHHLLVLEEAHNIFQRSNGVNSEGGENMAGKSVRMLAQCIAEMRSYGQGVFMADQAPSELDPASIRNTSTKVVMRLSETADQQAVGNALSLTEEQMRELAHLPRQVALVYQGGWIEPVLIRVNDNTKVVPVDEVDMMDYEDLKRMRGALTAAILPMYEKGHFDAASLQRLLQTLTYVNPSKKKDYGALIETFGRRYAEDDIESEARCGQRVFYGTLLTELLACDGFFKALPVPIGQGTSAEAEQDDLYIADCNAWRNKAVRTVEQYASGLSKEQRKQLLRLLMCRDSRNYAVIAAHNMIYAGRIS